MSNTCNLCKFYEGDETEGLCRRYASRPWLGFDTETEVDRSPFWPVVGGDIDWCGEIKEDTERLREKLIKMDNKHDRTP